MVRTYEKIEQLWDCIGTVNTKKIPKEVFLGVDVGTANVVTVAVDENGIPVTGEITPARVTREGIIMDYIGAVGIVREHVDKISARLGIELQYGVSAIPPQTEDGNKKVTKNVLEGASLDVLDIIDESTAAAIALGIDEGIVVDIGGGSTGIAILEDGKVTYTADEPTGGFALDLVIAGNYKISTEEAEERKRDPGNQDVLFHIVKPVFEKLASIANRHSVGTSVKTIYMVGGTSSFKGFDGLMEKETGRAVILPEHALLVTPVGMALSCARTAMALRR
jgi:ethanolamine utilization protein EutJ